MIDPFDVKVGFHVFYQQPHMRGPEYGVITGVHHGSGDALDDPSYVRVRFLGDATSKSCRPQDLHWPPDFCAPDRVNPAGQVFGRWGVR